MKSASSQGQLMLSIGALLTAERERRGIPVEKAAKETRMRPQRIRDMENDDLSHFTNPSYARMFIIAYAKYLDIPMQTIGDHLPELGTPSAEGYQYINADPGELPSLRRDLVSRPLRRGWLPGVMIGALVCLVLAVIAGVTFLIVNLPRLSSTGGTAGAGASEPDATPVLVTKVVVVEQPHLENLPTPEPTPVDPVAPSVLNAAAATPAPAPFTERASIAAPPRPRPIVTLGADPTTGTGTNLQSALPTPTPAKDDDDRAFLLNSENEQTIPAN